MPIDVSEIEEIVEPEQLHEMLEKDKAYSHSELFELMYGYSPILVNRTTGKFEDMLYEISLLSIRHANLMATVTRLLSEEKLIQGKKDNTYYFWLNPKKYPGI